MITSFQRAGARALLALTLASPAAQAQADHLSASANFFNNARKAGLDMNELALAHAAVSPTLVKGLYAAYNDNGSLVAIINEAGTLYGKAGTFSTLGPKRGSLRVMTPKEVGELRAEVMANIAFDRLIKVTYGNGGGRRILAFSSLDCGTCQIHEKELAAAGPSLNTTFYIAPSSLRGLNAEGRIFMDQIARMRCADDAGAAWQRFWATRKPVPVAAGQCAVTAESAYRDTEALSSIMAGVKSMIQAVPMFVAEDGSPIAKNFNVDMTPALADGMFGATRKRAPLLPATKWLASAAAAGPGKAR